MRTYGLNYFFSGRAHTTESTVVLSQSPVDSLQSTRHTDSPSKRRPFDIIIPTWRRSPTLQETIDVLLRQCREQDCIFIVSQGKIRPSIKPDSRVKVLHCRVPNLPAARNAGLRAGNSPLVLYIDDDCLVKPGLLDAHASCYHDNLIGAVAGYVDDPLFSGLTTKVPSFFNPATGELIQHFNLPLSQPSLSVMGANMSFLRTALEIVNGFDENYLHNAIWEEIDVSFRIRHAGFAIHYCSLAKVRHLRQPDGGCRHDPLLCDLYHQFANTAYFACTFASLHHVVTWIKFWIYRLEYLSRGNAAKKNTGRIRHDLLSLIAGTIGIAAGCGRFLIHGKRRGPNINTPCGIRQMSRRST